ncbi:TSUP family transporter [Pseudophaeobacter flagellatus]|uniref:TSUP family transporter n=1 Tax=Pseudophaeobacter flagellatus TaxID=2899119 RepID=UPI001E501D82|nr:TSUP family transporter [Pseudophaeobacter flagellatus]MCD9148039.1 TSUP family transporter [Pseudophaeobacter flagellatus]
MNLPFDLTSGQGAYLAAALFAAAGIRGYSGFGFSAIFIILAALTTNPLPLIPVIFTCEITMTLFQARGIRAHVDWRRAGALLLGAVLTVIPAVALMARLDHLQARLAVSGLILVLSLILLSGWQFTRPIGMLGHTGVGMISGTANAAGVGGLPTAAFLSAQLIAPATFRATMIVFLTGIDLMALPAMSAHGLVTGETVFAALLAFPILGAGVWLGSQGFARADPARFRRKVVLLLAALAGLNIVKVAL